MQHEKREILREVLKTIHFLAMSTGVGIGVENLVLGKRAASAKHAGLIGTLMSLCAITTAVILFT